MEDKLSNLQLAGDGGQSRGSVGRAGISESKQHQLVLVVLGIVAQRLDLNRKLVIQVLAPSLGR